MGVMACNRRGCENIMCDRYSPRYGYICDRCFKELCRLGPSVDLAEFMHTQPQGDKQGITRYLAEFPLCRESDNG